MAIEVSSASAARRDVRASAALSRRRLVALAGLAATLLVCAPFVGIAVPSMVDYPNHLARMYILSHLDRSTILQQFYLAEWRPLPNVGMDAVIVPLVSLTGWSVETVARLFAMVVAASFVPAVMLLAYAFHRRWTLWSAGAASLIAFNYVLLYGFINYLAGVDLALVGAALWLLRNEAKPWRNALLFAPMALATFFAHFYAFALYGTLLATHEAWRLAQARGERLALLKWQLVDALQFAPPLYVFFVLSPMAGNVSLGRVKASSLADKATALYTVLDVGHRGVTLASFAVVGAIVLYGLASRRLRVAPAGAAMTALLAAIFVAMPFTLLGSGFADFRLPIVIAAVIVAAMRWDAVPRQLSLVMGLAITLLAVGRIGVVAADWHRGDARYAAIVHALAPLPQGARLLPVIAAEDGSMDFLRRPPIEHSAELAVLAKDAFVPTLFAEEAKQPMVFQPAYARLRFDSALVDLRDHPAAPGGPLDPRRLADYDYVAIFARPTPPLDLPAGLTRVDNGSASNFALYRVERAR